MASRPPAAAQTAAARALTLRPFRLAEALIRAGRGLSTSELVDHLGELTKPGMTRQIALTRCGQELHRLELAQRVVRAGATRGRWQHRPSVIWQITPAGRSWVDERLTRAANLPSPAPATAQGRTP